MFRRKATDFATDWDRKPWWKVVSLAGWGLVLLGCFATASLFFGAAYGEVLLLLAVKSRSGPMSFSLQESPILFWLIMALNALIAGVIWFLLASWIKERRR
jgi:hypothetical protein